MKLPLILATTAAVSAATVIPTGYLGDTVTVPEGTVTVSVQMSGGGGTWSDVYSFRIFSEERAFFRIQITEP